MFGYDRVERPTSNKGKNKNAVFEQYVLIIKHSGAFGSEKRVQTVPRKSIKVRRLALGTEMA